MAVIPIRDVPGEAVEPSGNELILIDNGIAMQKATINDAVTPKATEIADDKIAALNLGTASQANVEDFATAAQGLLADSAVLYAPQTLNSDQKAQARANINAPERIVLDVVAPGGAGVGGAVPLTLLNNKAYTIRLNTLGTGTMTGAVYNLWRDSAVWQLKRLSGISGANHPELRLDSSGNGLEVFTQHANNYTIRLHIDAWDINNPNGIAESFFDPFYTKEESDQRYATAAQGTKADNAVPTSRTISAGTGLTGGGDLSADRTISLDASSIASLALADSAVQPADLEAVRVPAGGATGQVLVKESNDDNDVGWATVAAATAVSYAPQTLNSGQKAQARANIAARRALTGTDYIFPAIGEGEVILEAGTEDEVFREYGNVIFDPDDEAYPWKLTYAAHQGAYEGNNVYVYGAKSADGKTWLKIGKLFTRAAEDPYLVKHNGTFYLFVEDKADVPFRNIRLFSATDFEGSWTDDGDVLDIGTGWEATDVSSPVVWEEGGTWYMLYEGRAPGQRGAIGLATALSPDGPWTKDAGNPIITGWETAPGPLGWASHLVPDDIRKVDGKYYLLVHGYLRQNTFNTIHDIAFVPGLLVSSDLTNWHDPLGSPISVPVAAGSTNDIAVSGDLQFFELDGELFVLGCGSEAGLGVYRPLTAVRNIFKAGTPQVEHPMEANTLVEFPDFTVVTLDSLTGFDADTNEWVCKRSGFYRFTAMLSATPAEPNSLLAVAVFINGGATSYVLGQDMCGELSSGLPAGVTADGADTLYLLVGDKVKFYGLARAGLLPASNNLVRASVTVELVG